MSASQLLRRGVAAIAATTLIAVGLIASSPAPAHAEPVTVTDPTSGASITLSSNQVAPGERIEISGTGFVATQGTTGEPLVAVRPYDFDRGPAWTIGGDDAYFPGAHGNATAQEEAKYWFVTHHDRDGSFKGWIQAPASLTKNGPQGNGSHWLRILSGAFFTTTGDRLTDQITFQVPFTVADKVILGMTSPTGVFQEGTTFRPGAQMTVRGRGFTPASTVAVSLDGTSLASDVKSEADGSLPANARVGLPSGVSPGTHTLRLATGTVAVSVPITVTPAPTATVLTERVRPGGTLAFDLTGYIGVSGQQQKIAVVIDEQVLACVDADRNGAAKGVVTLPSSLSGQVVVGFNVGLSCIMPPTGVVNDQPVSRMAPTITVSDTAAVVEATEDAGGKLALSGSGFTPNATVTITVGDTKIGTLTANNAGTANGSLATTLSPGTYRVLAGDGASVAATSLKLTATPAASLTLSAPTPLTYGAARTTTVGLKVAGAASKGTVRISQGGWSRNVSVPTGGLKVALPRDAAVGSHTVTASIPATDGHTSAKTSRTFKVTKAASTATLKVSPSKVKKSKRAKATIRVAVKGASQIAATGKVAIYDGSKKLGTYTLKAGHRGALQVTLPKIKKKGTHKLKAKYAGTANISAKTSSVVKLKVVR